ncbi:MAG: Hsp20/alpha crystallin family protein [Bauldia sp.]
MAELVTKLPVKTDEGGRGPALGGGSALDTLQKEIDRLFEDFNRGSWRFPFRRSVFGVEPMWRGEVSWGAAVPAVDVVENDKAYQITAELPGIDEKNIELKVSHGVLSIKGEKSEEKEEKKKGYYLSERRFGSFERSFGMPEGVEVDKIDASFKNGVLTVSLPKKAEAQKPEKKITVKAA